MNEENSLEFKDKEIEKISADLNKASKHQFGGDFEGVIGQAKEGDAAKEKESGQPPSGVPAQEPPSEVKIPEQINPTNTPETTATNEAKNELYSVVKPLQTYERDIADTIRNHGESVASINIAAQKKQVEQKTVVEKTERAAGSGIKILVGIVMILAALGIIFLIYYFFANKPPEVTPAAPSLISTNEKKAIDVTGMLPEQAIGEIRSALEVPNQAGNLTEIKLVEGLPGEKTNITSEKLSTILAPSAPSSLGRALGPEWILGFHSTEENNPFIFITIASFDNAFDGMLRWERGMRRDLAGVFIKPGTIIPEPLSVTESGFQDVVIENKDVRVLKDIGGNIVLMYSFVDTKNLLITTNEKTFGEVLNRFFASRIVR